MHSGIFGHSSLVPDVLTDANLRLCILRLVLYCLLVPFQAVSPGKPALLGRIWTVCQVTDPRLPVFITMLAVQLLA